MEEGFGLSLGLARGEVLRISAKMSIGNGTRERKAKRSKTQSSMKYLVRGEVKNIRIKRGKERRKILQKGKECTRDGKRTSEVDVYCSSPESLVPPAATGVGSAMPIWDRTDSKVYGRTNKKAGSAIAEKEESSQRRRRTFKSFLLAPRAATPLSSRSASVMTTMSRHLEPSKLGVYFCKSKREREKNKE
jgi:hypothetical protein